MTPRGVAVLGATGSIGTSALRVLDRHPDRFRLVAATAHGSVSALQRIVDRYRPSFVGLVDGETGAAPNAWHRGIGVLEEAARLPEADVVLNAVVGAAGFPATLAALHAGKRVALANKESLVLGGDLCREAARAGGGEILPVDSEHSAILQCVGTRPFADVRRVVLTASGGPFRLWPAERIASASVTEALRHPTWSMGRKISIDSATLANKALEVIEAHHLFGLRFDQIDVVVHPQSIVHSFVEFVDGSVVAQLGVPTMELPVLYALSHPDRLEDDGVPRYDPVQGSPLTFEAVRHREFPTLQLGIDAGRTGGAAPAVFNAANEVAVERFLAGEIAFGVIPRCIAGALETLGGLPGTTKDELLAADRAARTYVRDVIRC